jgi:hypothetical protein
MRRLGSGGLGEVFLASQLFSTPDDALRAVALKAIRPELLASPRHRLIRENDLRIASSSPPSGARGRVGSPAGSRSA